MSMQMMKAFVMVLVFIQLLTCALAQKDSRLVLDLSPFVRRSPKNPVTLNVGDSFEVLLRETPHSGYQWALIEEEMIKDKADTLVKLVDRSFQPDKARNGAGGGGGYTTMEFAIIGAGKGTLKIYMIKPSQLEDFRQNVKDVDYENIYMMKEILLDTKA